MAENDAIAALTGLRTVLGSQSTLRVLGKGGHVWEAAFAFGESASLTQIEAVESALGLRLPPVYREFLAAHDGATLYQDPQYFQWGYRIFGTSNLVESNTTVQRMNAPEWIPQFLAYAECLGDSDFLVLDTSRPTTDGRDCVVLDAAGGERPSQWEIAAPSFAVWIDRLIVAQGQKYWLWR